MPCWAQTSSKDARCKPSTPSKVFSRRWATWTAFSPLTPTLSRIASSSALESDLGPRRARRSRGRSASAKSVMRNGVFSFIVQLFLWLNSFPSSIHYTIFGCRMQAYGGQTVLMCKNRIASRSLRLCHSPGVESTEGFFIPEQMYYKFTTVTSAILSPQSPYSATNRNNPMTKIVTHRFFEYFCAINPVIR